MTRILTALTIALTAQAVIAQTQQQHTPEIYASVYSANSWVEHQLEEIGIYRFAADNYAPELIKQDPYLDASGGGAMTDDFYFCTVELNFGDFVDITHYAFDPDTWTESLRLTDGLPGAVATDMTYDPQTAKIYGCFNSDSGDGFVFGTLNEANGQRKKISDIDIPWLACSIDRNGQLYAIDMAGNLMKVNKANGSATLLGNLGITAGIRSTGAIDPRTGLFYFVVSSQDADRDPELGFRLTHSDLYSVDINAATPVAKHLYALDDGEVMGGMWIPGPIADNGAPDAPDNLFVNFPQGALNGTVEFSIPAKTFGGSDLTGEVSWSIRANGELLAEGKSTATAKVSAPAKVDKAGMYQIELTLSNQAGRSPKVKQKMWLGHDMPRPITAVDLSYAQGKFILSWNAPAESEHGGYFDPSKISYTVLRHPDGKTFNNLTAPELSDEVPIPDGLEVYSYDVTLNYNGTSMPPVTSNIWRLGSVKLPWSTEFNAENALDLFTRIDVNGDKNEWYREWEWYIEATDELVAAVAYPYSSTNPADDWLITPPFMLETGKTYTLGFEAMVMSESDPERMAVYYGEAPLVNLMTNEIFAPFEMTNMSPEQHSTDITVNTSGIYYIGFHACSEPNKSGLALKSISLTAKSSDIESVASPDPIDITTDNGTITISAPEATPYCVTTADGRIITSGTTTSKPATLIPLPTGIYIVKAGPEARKLHVNR